MMFSDVVKPGPRLDMPLYAPMLVKSWQSRVIEAVMH